ncbi:MAG: TIGR04086 family membrane protein, partial [Clostridia bacterium]
FSLAFVLLFALIVRWASLDGKVIVPVNYAIKVLSIFLGALFGFKNAENGIIKGAVGGLLYTLFSFLIFASLDGFKSAHFNWIDLLCLSVAGGIAGIIVVNLKSHLQK